MESNVMYVKDDLGNEVEMTILFTFDKVGVNYVVFQPSGDESGEVFASRYNEDGELLPIETEEEWDMVEEVIGAFSDEEDNNAEA